MSKVEASNPLITALVPTFNRARLLRRAITSVLDQTGPALQVWVFDNASEDETSDVIARLASCDSRVVHFRHERNIGATANFDVALRSVNTPFFSFLSDDDYLLPGFYERATNALHEHPQAMYWAGLTLNVDDSGVIWEARVLNWLREGLYGPPEGFFSMLGGFAPTWTSIVFRKEARDLVGLIDANMGGPSDLEYCLRLAARYPYILDKHPSAVFSLSDSNYSSIQPMSAFWPGWKNMIRKFAEDASLDEQFRRDAAEGLQRDAERMLFRRGANGLAKGRIEFARDAADGLVEDCGKRLSGGLLRLLAGVCERSDFMQRRYTTTYRWLERRIVRSRNALQIKYGHLLRRG